MNNWREIKKDTLSDTEARFLVFAQCILVENWVSLLANSEEAVFFKQEEQAGHK